MKDAILSNADLLRGLAICGFLAFGFLTMATARASQILVMPLVACAALTLFPAAAPKIVSDAFQEFGIVALLFTAIAIPAHLVQRSGGFDWVGALLGRHIGVTTLHHPDIGNPLLIVFLLLTTYIAAALFHNITSILVMVPITITICRNYGIASRYVLCGLLIASNLGGFSSSWGDTPNIVESAVWGLTNNQFLTEIVPINLLVLAGLSASVIAISLGGREARAGRRDPVKIAEAIVRFKRQQQDTAVDPRMLLAGLGTLAGFIGFQYFFHQYEIAGAAAAILVAVLADRKEHRLESLKSLDLDVYFVLASVFVIARTVDQSALGDHLRLFVQSMSGAPWAIALSSFLGTAVTEAASWAAAVAHTTHDANPSHAGAWALGSGICAGSSALLTSASAGIILLTESRRFRGHEVNFSAYMGFGLAGSILMLAFYILCFSLIY
jgi:Na+/H+ antiporter NhaD/arsenite permease-like protein